MGTDEACVEQIDVSAYRTPTDRPESDGTLRWDSTTIVVVEARCADRRGLGYSYTHRSAAALCDARSLPLSGHTAPALHAHVACAMPSMRHLEYFHDHVRIEEQLFDGVLQPVGGALRPDRARPGMGLELKREDAEQFRV